MRFNVNGRSVTHLLGACFPAEPFMDVEEGRITVDTYLDEVLCSPPRAGAVNSQIIADDPRVRGMLAEREFEDARYRRTEDDRS